MTKFASKLFHLCKTAKELLSCFIHVKTAKEEEDCWKFASELFHFCQNCKGGGQNCDMSRHVHLVMLASHDLARVVKDKKSTCGDSMTQQS